MLMERLNYNLLFRWFVGLNMDGVIWDATVFTKNRQRLLAGDIAEAFFEAVLKQARQRNLLSDEHLTVEGRLGLSFTAAAYNVVRIRNLIVSNPQPKGA
jgi:transposase